MTAPDASVIAAIEAGPMDDAREALSAGAMDRLLDPTPLEVETGWCWTPEQVAYVAVRTEMPATTGPMWDWWFDWHQHDPLRYRVWYPGMHFDISSKAPTERGAKPFWGATHYPVEDIGLGRDTVRIEFKRPSEYGFSTDALDDQRVATIVGGYVGVPARHLRVGVVSHVFLHAGDGLILRSRFWLGSDLRPDLPGRLGDALGRLINRSALRRRAIPRRLPQCLARHCATEYAHLASMLPELHTRFGTAGS